MKKSSLLIALLFTLSAAQAHTHLKSSDPANASMVTVAPTSIALEFGAAVRLTALTITTGKATVQKIADLPATPQQKFTLTAPALGKGEQLVEWRAIGTDGHVMSGKFKFTVGAATIARP